MDDHPHYVLRLGDTPAKATRVLGRYLPGLSLGLVALAADRMLVPASTVRALGIEYGQSSVGAILVKAGATEALAVDDAGAIALLRARNAQELPPRPAISPVAGVDWHLDAVSAPQAWALFGGPQAIDYAGVRVGHIDTGYTRHPALGFDGPAPWVDVGLSQTFFAPSTPTDDPGPGGGVDPLSTSMDGHGTRTASTICGFAPAAGGRPFHGVAPKAPLVCARIANHVWINHAQAEFAQAVTHLVSNAGVGVISLSMGIFLSFIRQELRAALDAAYDAGVIVVCAAGNIVESVVAPARLNRTLAIAGATTVDGRLVPWSGSSHGPEVDVSGPAEGIRRADMKKGKPVYSTGGDGTSYATAMTAGAAALWLARHAGTLDTAYPKPWQRVEAFKQLVREQARLPDGWHPGEFGTGVLDVHALLTAALPPAATRPDGPA